jgi:hypothetical protein
MCIIESIGAFGKNPSLKSTSLFTDYMKRLPSYLTIQKSSDQVYRDERDMKVAMG